MKNIYDNLTLRVGDKGEFALEDGKYLYLKGIGPEGDVEMFIDAEYDLRVEDQLAIQDVLHRYCRELKDVLKKALKHKTKRENRTLSGENQAKGLIDSYNEMRLLQLREDYNSEKCHNRNISELSMYKEE